MSLADAENKGTFSRKNFFYEGEKAQCAFHTTLRAYFWNKMCYFVSAPLHGWYAKFFTCFSFLSLSSNIFPFIFSRKMEEGFPGLRGGHQKSFGSQTQKNFSDLSVGSSHAYILARTTCRGDHITYSDLQWPSYQTAKVPYSHYLIIWSFNLLTPVLAGYRIVGLPFLCGFEVGYTLL